MQDIVLTFRITTVVACVKVIIHDQRWPYAYNLIHKINTGNLFFFWNQYKVLQDVSLPFEKKNHMMLSIEV